MNKVVNFFEKALDKWFSSNKSIQPKGFKFVSQSKDANFEFIEIWYPNPEGPLDDLSWGMYTIAKAQRPEVMFGENKDKIYDLINISETDMRDFEIIINKLS